ncbi:hypothetical protein FOCC_FOCC006976, partial [Frankliniella occidentalis]
MGQLSLSALRNRSAGRPAGAAGWPHDTWRMEGDREREVTCMKADGNCYFYAVTATGGVQDDVAAEAGGPSGLRHAAELRRQAAEYIRANPDVFEAVSLAAAADDPGGYARYTEAAPGGGVRLADSRGAAGRLASWLQRDSVEEAPAAARRARTAVYFSFEAQRGPDAPPDAQQDAPVGEVYGVSLVTVWQDGVRKLHHGSVGAASLPGALLALMGTGDMEFFLFLAGSLGRSFGKRAMEDGLDEAWRTARALNLPLSADMERCVVFNLVMLRYVLSREYPTSDVPPAADAHERWHELWGRVALLLEYSRRLQDELERLQCDDGVPGCADLSVMLVRLCTLALRNAKRSFAATYKEVPWEEMEYLLVMFIKGRTVLVTLAHWVASVRSTAAHLRCFRDRVETYVVVHRAEPNPEVAMKRLQKEPRKERAVILAGVVDGALTDLRKDFALLMDWQSLMEITETLGIASEVLDILEDADWAAWGWLALRWALFVVGERVKYSWTSPNLSPRWAGLIEALAPGGVLKIMSTIRDDQEHGKDGSNAKTLVLSEIKKSERAKLREELLKLANAARAALEAAVSEVECSDDNDWDGQERVTVTKRDSEGRKDLIGEELLKILEPAKHKAEGAFEAIRALAHREIEPHLRAACIVDKFLSFAREHIPEAAPRVRRLLLNKSAENIESFHAVLREVTPPSVSSPLETLRRALTAVDAAPEGQLRDFAFCGALRELASRWHEDDQVVPTAVPFSPALFGRQLRNYLNHLDEGLFVCSPQEIPVLYNLLQRKYIPLEQGARPRLRDPWWSRAENERLRRLVELKSDMFRYAREGELGELQRLVENGAYLSVRDCQDRTLLHAAAQGGQVHVVEWLLGLGAEVVDPLAKDWRGYTALYDAGTTAVAEALLNAGPVHQNGIFTPLHHAAWCGRAEVVAVLLKGSRDLDAEDNERRTPLHWAALHGHDQVVRLLLEAGARCQADVHGHTPLVFAAFSGSAPTVRLLLGATPPPADEDCWRAAMLTAWFASEEACFALLDELEARGLLQWGPAAREALLQTGFGGSSAIALRLLGLSPDALREGLMSDTGAAVLQAAAFVGRADLVRTLLRCGADPLCKDAGGVTALATAAVGASGVGGVPDTVTALVERIPRGDLQAALAQALCSAAKFGRLGTVQRLVHHGADVNAEGGTPLGWAARSGHTEVVRWLLQRGADPCLGRLGAPLHMAAAHGRLGVVKVLVPPLHGGEEGQGEPGSEEPSALRVAVQDGSREDVERILRRFVEHLRPLSSRYTKEDRLRDKAEATAALRRKEKEDDERLRLLQQLDSDGQTALHCASAVSALPVVEYLLDREGELLRPVYSKHKNIGVPRLDGLSVYSRDAGGGTALEGGVLGLCAPSVAEALLKRMGDTMWMALGHKDLQEVRSMAEEALEHATLRPDSGRLVRALCGWLSRSGEGLLSGKGEEGLQDMRRCVLARA